MADATAEKEEGAELDVLLKTEQTFEPPSEFAAQANASDPEIYDRTERWIAAGRAAGVVVPCVAIRPVGSFPAGSGWIIPAGTTSRRSKSLPHHAHRDQSSPTSREQLGQTRLRRVLHDGQMIHSASTRRSQVGQCGTDSTSLSNASSARFRSQTSPIFSCGRMIL